MSAEYLACHQRSDAESLAEKVAVAREKCQREKSSKSELEDVSSLLVKPVSCIEVDTVYLYAEGSLGRTEGEACRRT